MNEPIVYPRALRRGFPVRMILLVLVLVLLLFLILILRDTFDPAAQAAREAEAYRQDILNDRLSGLDTLIAAAWRILPLALISGTACVALSIAWRRWGQHEYIKAHHVTELTRATAQRFPAGLHSLSFHDSSRPQISPPTGLTNPKELASTLDKSVEAPAFAALLHQGAIGIDREGRCQPLILGFTAGGPQVGDWRSLYSTGLGGLQGGGKTWTAVYLLAQSALNGARLVIGDPHASVSDESLAARIAPLTPALLCEIAEDDKRILAALKLADDELQRRKRGISKETWPLIVAIDEWTSLRRGELATVLPALIEDFTTEGRKLNCHLMLMAQRWDKESVGDFRNTLASAYIHRMRPIEARMMTGLPAAVMPNDTLQLEPGECYLLDTRGQLVRMRIPTMTPDDIQQVAHIIKEQADTTKASRPFGFRPSAPAGNRQATGRQPAGNGKEPAMASESDKALDPQTTRILTLFVEGKRVAEIVELVFGISSETGGRRYRQLRDQVESIIQQAFTRIAGNAQ